MENIREKSHFWRQAEGSSISGAEIYCELAIHRILIEGIGFIWDL